MQKIVPHLWFDNEAEEAAKLYVSLFPGSKLGPIARYTKAGFEIHKQPEGKVMTVEFVLAGHSFVGLNGGPAFTFNPSISFMVACETKDEVESLWQRLSVGGSSLMELGEYPFSEKYGWLRDKYGLSWQLMYMGGDAITQKITPTLLFVGDVCGKAEDAISLYTSVFPNSAIGAVTRYGEDHSPDKPESIMHADFLLNGQQFAAMDSAAEHHFMFNEAISFMVLCDTQEEIDAYWSQLSVGGDPAAQVCGWLKDKYGVSWQVTPTVLGDMLQDADKQKVERVTNAFMKMKKFDLAELKKAYEG